jgi:transcriptional regulator with XRE-family HTH domain
MDLVRFGRSVRALRQRRDWRQVDLAGRAGLSRSVIGRIEFGQSDRIALGDLEAVAEALDGQLGLDFRWRGEALDRLIDQEHASIVDQVVGIYRAARWEVAVEASFSIYGERGPIDAFAWHPEVQVVAVNEIKASIGDAGNTVIGVDRKERLAPRIAAERGWPCRGVARFLVVREGTTVRRRIAAHADLFRTAFPAASRQALDWIRSPSRERMSGLIFLPDARPAGSRRGGTSRRRVRAQVPRTPSAARPR